MQPNRLVELAKTAQCFPAERLHELIQRFDIRTDVCTTFCRRFKEGNCTHPQGPHGYCVTSFLIDPPTRARVEKRLLANCTERYREALEMELHPAKVAEAA